MRVINAARSPNAQIFVNMKFSIDTPYEKIQIFKAAVEQFLKDDAPNAYEQFHPAVKWTLQFLKISLYLSPLSLSIKKE